MFVNILLLNMPMFNSRYIVIFSPFSRVTWYKHFDNLQNINGAQVQILPALKQKYASM